MVFEKNHQTKQNPKVSDLTPTSKNVSELDIILSQLTHFHIEFNTFFMYFSLNKWNTNRKYPPIKQRTLIGAYESKKKRWHIQIGINKSQIEIGTYTSENTNQTNMRTGKFKSEHVILEL